MKGEIYQWGHSRRFNSYTEHIRNTFGGRMQKVVVDAGFTCPNRDGLVAYGGMARKASEGAPIAITTPSIHLIAAL